VFKTPVKVYGEYLDSVKDKVFLGTNDTQNNKRVIKNVAEAGPDRVNMMN